ncbi:MAG: hypothetical protein GY944_22220, partial [bacterium]|nr:hypothetical protein [bacterium]
MVSKLLLAGLSLLVLTPTASADRFYFGSPTTAQKISDGTADFIEGVLLREADGQYVIRVEGGEISVAKSLVWKVESNELTVAQLEAREQGATAALASANDIRRERQTTAAATRRNVLLEARAPAASL